MGFSFSSKKEIGCQIKSSYRCCNNVSKEKALPSLSIRFNSWIFSGNITYFVYQSPNKSHEFLSVIVISIFSRSKRNNSRLA